MRVFFSCHEKPTAKTMKTGMQLLTKPKLFILVSLFITALKLCLEYPFPSEGGKAQSLHSGLRSYNRFYL